jgi:hypothetical protein
MTVCEALLVLIANILFYALAIPAVNKASFSKLPVAKRGRTKFHFKVDTTVHDDFVRTAMPLTNEPNFWKRNHSRGARLVGDLAKAQNCKTWHDFQQVTFQNVVGLGYDEYDFFWLCRVIEYFFNYPLPSAERIADFSPISLLNFVKRQSA